MGASRCCPLLHVARPPRARVQNAWVVCANLESTKVVGEWGNRNGPDGLNQHVHSNNKKCTMGMGSVPRCARANNAHTTH